MWPWTQGLLEFTLAASWAALNARAGGIYSGHWPTLPWPHGPLYSLQPLGHATFGRRTFRDTVTVVCISRRGTGCVYPTTRCLYRIWDLGTSLSILTSYYWRSNSSSWDDIYDVNFSWLLLGLTMIFISDIKKCIKLTLVHLLKLIVNLWFSFAYLPLPPNEHVYYGWLLFLWDITSNTVKVHCSHLCWKMNPKWQKNITYFK